MGEFRMPSLGADMEAGTLVEWLVQPGERVKGGDVIATVETQKGLFEIENFEEGIMGEPLVQPGQKVPVGTVLAMIHAEGAPITPAEASTEAAEAPVQTRRPLPPPSLPPRSAGTEVGEYRWAAFGEAVRDLGEPLEPFFEACGGRQTISLSVRRFDSRSPPETFVFQQPFVVIGPGVGTHDALSGKIFHGHKIRRRDPYPQTDIRSGRSDLSHALELSAAFSPGDLRNRQVRRHDACGSGEEAGSNGGEGRHRTQSQGEHPLLLQCPLCRRHV